MRVAPFVAVALTAISCQFAWDDLDPRLQETGSVTGSGTPTGTGSGGGGQAGGGGGSAGGSGGTGGASGGGGGGDGGGVVLPCATIAMLADDYDDAMLPAEWSLFGSGAMTVDEVGGELTFTVGAPTVYRELHSDLAFDLRDGSVSIELTSVVGSNRAQFFVFGENDDYAELSARAGNELGFFLTESGQLQALGAVNYDPVAHRHLRFRVALGTMYWETSADGVNWAVGTQLPTASIPWDLRYTRVAIAAQGSNGEVRYDNLNGGGPPQGAWCPIADLRDDFDAGVSDAFRISTNATGCTSAGAADELLFEVALDASASCDRSSSSRYDLTAGALTVEVPSPPVAPNIELLISVGPTGDDFAEIAIGDGLIAYALFQSGVAVATAGSAFDPQQQRYFRIAESNGDLSFGSSQDAINWTEDLVTAALIDVRNVSVNFEVAAAGLHPAAQITIDNVNVLP